MQQVNTLGSVEVNGFDVCFQMVKKKFRMLAQYIPSLCKIKDVCRRLWPFLQSYQLQENVKLTIPSI